MPFDWSKLLELAPLALMRPGTPEGAAMMRGYMREQERIRQQQLQQQQFTRQDEYHQAQMANMEADNRRAQEQLEMQRQQQALQRLSQAIGAFNPAIEGVAETATDPTQAENQLLQRSGAIESAYGLQPSQLSGFIPPMTPIVSARKKKRAQALYEQVEKQYGPEALANDSITLRTEEFGEVKPSQLRALFSVPAVTAQGQPATPAMPKRAKSLQSKEMLVRGQPTVVNFDPETGEYFDQEGQRVRATPIPPQPREGRDERLVQIEGPDGKAIWVRESAAEGKPAAQAARAITGQERQTLAFYNRAKEADELANQVEETVAEAGLISQYQQQYAPNIAQTRDQQRYRQAQRAFTEARLRKESGAAIPIAEYENDARTYFAQPGDTPEVRAQKRRARQTVLDGLKFASGRAHEEFYGEPATRTPPAGGAKFEILDVK